MLSAKDISFDYDNSTVLKGTTLSVNSGDRIALVGGNGVGKSTLLKILAGIITPHSGSVSKPNNLAVGYMPQEIDEYSNLSSKDFLSHITGTDAALKSLEVATANYAKAQTPDTLARYQDCYDKVENFEAYTFEERLPKYLSKVGLQSSILEFRVGQLSGGQKTKLALVAILMSHFDVFLLDEPTNNLDLEGLKILEDFMHSTQSAFVVISHDRRFIRGASTKIMEVLPGGKIKTYTLGYDEYLGARRRENEAIKQTHDNFSDEKKRLMAAARDREYSARSGGGRASDNDKLSANARSEKAQSSHAKAAGALKTRLGQLEEPTRPDKHIDLNFRFDAGTEKLPSVAVTLIGAGIEFANTKLGPYDLQVNTGDKVVIVGPNGGGKSTLIRLIAGEIKPTSGTLSLTRGIKVGYINQGYSFKDNTKSVIANIQSDCNVDISELYNTLARFNIKKDKADSLPGELSPGQRSRALLASMVAQGINLLILDEPTNHLDIPASDELTEALKDYQGTLIVVTHDRELLDAIEGKKLRAVIDGRVLSEAQSDRYIHKSLGNQ